jgi:8-oxo-dGTP diphosphatase
MGETTLCFLVRPKEILLAMKKRRFGAGKLNGVGGKMLPGETVPEAAIREIEEEIGVKVETQDLEKVAELHFTFENKKEWDQISHVFFIRKWKGEPQETEEMNPEWFSMENIPYKRMWLDDEYWYPLVLAGKKIKGNFHFSNDGSKILDYSLSEVKDFV